MKYIKFYKKAGVLIIALVTIFSFAMATIGEEEIEDTSSKAVTWDAQLDFSETYLGKNDYVIFGEAPDATDGPPNDGYDTPKSPAPPSPYIRAYFDDGLTAPYNKLLKDYRFYPDDAKTWNLSVEWDNDTGTWMTISWNISEVYLSEYDSMMLWRKGQINSTWYPVANMFTENSFTWFHESMYIDPPGFWLWFLTDEFEIRCATDDEPPEITDNTVGPGYTGETFTINATVTDNVGLGGAKVDWSHGGFSSNDTMGNVGGNYFEKEITLDESTSDLSYTIYAEDTAKTPNTNTTPVALITVNDDENPTPVSDDTTTNPTTGEPITFGLTVSDNIDINYVYANYRWYQGGTWSGWTTDVTMSEGASDDWTTSGLSTPSDATEVEYYFEVYDGTFTVYIYNGSLAVTTDEGTAQGSAFEKPVEDNDDPTLVDSSPVSGTTGDSYTFDVDPDDNIGVSGVTVTWNHGILSGVAVAMSDDGDGTYSLTIILDDNLGNMDYTITVTDTSANTFTDATQYVTVSDNDDPTLVDSSPVSGTTGDSYTFDVDPDDNIGVSGVTVTWNHGILSGVAVAMSDDGDGTYSLTIILDDNLGNMDYTITVTDTSANTFTDATQYVTVSDNDDPTLVDSSPVSGTTGDSYTFDVDPDDNIGVSGVTVTWNHGILSGVAVAMSDDGDGTYSLTIILDDNLGNMDYTITVTDTSANTFTDATQYVTVSDNDDPTLVDSSPVSGTTGDSYTFDVDPDDNIGVSGVTVTWNHGILSGVAVAMSDDGDGTYSLTIILDDNLGNMDYTITVTDTSANTFTDATQYVTVSDNDDPTLVDSSPVSGTTGDSYTFDVDPDDNIGVSGVTVTWNHGILSGVAVAMSDDGDGTYSLTIILDDNLGNMDYTITVTDTSANTFTDATQYVTVSDNDDPTLVDSSPVSGTTGDSYTFDVDPDDNIGVSGVTVTWNHGILSGVAVAMSDDGDGTYSLTIILDDNLGNMDYTITVTDTSANTFTDATQYVTVSDNDDPTLVDSSPVSGTTGDSYTFDVDPDDNIGVSGVTVTWNHGILSGVAVAMSDDGDGTYSLTIILDDNLGNMDYTITVTDTSANTFTDATQYVTVSDNDDPTLVDSSPVSGTTGDSYTFDVDPDDNIGVSGVTVTWNHGILSGVAVAMSDDGDGTYSLTIILDDNLGNMDYTITVTDTSANTFTDATQYVTVSDNDDPVITDVSANPESQIVDGYVNITATVNDNINLNDVKVDITGPGGFTPVNVTMNEGSYYYNENYSYIGLYNFTIWAEDSSSNSITSAQYQFEIVNELKATNMIYQWNFMSIPFNESVDKSQVFIINNSIEYNWTEATDAGIILQFIYDWNRSSQVYEESETLEPGRGYWLWAYYDCELWVTGLSTIIADNYITAMEDEWNTIGIPADVTIDKTDLEVVYSGSTYNWTEATTGMDPIIIPFIFNYSRADQRYDEAVQIIPGESYWIYAYYECVLKWNET